MPKDINIRTSFFVFETLLKAQCSSMEKYKTESSKIIAKKICRFSVDVNSSYLGIIH